LDVLARHTATPDDCYFCVWDGWGSGVVPERRRWSSRTAPTSIWPADHAWCITNDVDPHWAGVGAAPAAIAELVDHARLDVVPADSREDQPCYTS